MSRNATMIKYQNIKYQIWKHLGAVKITYIFFSLDSGFVVCDPSAHLKPWYTKSRKAKLWKGHSHLARRPPMSVLDDPVTDTRWQPDLANPILHSEAGSGSYAIKTLCLQLRLDGLFWSAGLKHYLSWFEELDKAFAWRVHHRLNRHMRTHKMTWCNLQLHQNFASVQRKGSNPTDLLITFLLKVVGSKSSSMSQAEIFNLGTNIAPSGDKQEHTTGLLLSTRGGTVHIL